MSDLIPRIDVIIPKLFLLPGDGASSDEEPDQLIPINTKDDKAKVGKGKDDKTKKPPVDAKSKKPISSAAKVF